MVCCQSVPYYKPLKGQVSATYEGLTRRKHLVKGWSHAENELITGLGKLKRNWLLCVVHYLSVILPQPPANWMQRSVLMEHIIDNEILLPHCLWNFIFNMKGYEFNCSYIPLHILNFWVLPSFFIFLDFLNIYFDPLGRMRVKISYISGGPGDM